jgi:glycine betaine/proline transport system ATP-binding protein
VLDSSKQFLGVVSSQSLRTALHGRNGPLGLRHAFLPDAAPLDAATPVADLFGSMAEAPCPLPVVDAQGKFLGVISRTTMMRFLDRDTPPVPPPQPERAPLQLNPQFPSAGADPVARPH